MIELSEPRFLTVEQVERLHRKLIDRFGGTHGLRDPQLFEGAVIHPRNVEVVFPRDDTGLQSNCNARPTESRRHVQSAGYRGGASLDGELIEDMLDVLVHRAGGGADGFANLGVGFALGKAAEDFELAFGKAKLAGGFLGDARHAIDRAGFEQRLKLAFRLELMLPLGERDGD
jgi:hypothetical protein